MSSTPAAVVERRDSPFQSMMRSFRDRPVVPLLILLAILVVAFIALNPRTNVNEWIASTLRAAVLELPPGGNGTTSVIGRVG